jgi:hypothetical protein
MRGSVRFGRQSRDRLEPPMQMENAHFRALRQLGETRYLLRRLQQAAQLRDKNCMLCR